MSQRPIDLKQGGQFIEPLCRLTSSMIAQQVDSTSFEEEPPWKPSYKREIDKPYRPWYPEGAVHLAKYSLDTRIRSTANAVRKSNCRRRIHVLGFPRMDFILIPATSTGCGCICGAKAPSRCAHRCMAKARDRGAG